jgi:hypothetical protein
MNIKYILIIVLFFILIVLIYKKYEKFDNPIDTQIDQIINDTFKIDFINMRTLPTLLNIFANDKAIPIKMTLNDVTTKSISSTNLNSTNINNKNDINISEVTFNKINTQNLFINDNIKISNNDSFKIMPKNIIVAIPKNNIIPYGWVPADGNKYSISSTLNTTLNGYFNIDNNGSGLVLGSDLFTFYNNCNLNTSDDNLNLCKTNNNEISANDSVKFIIKIV